MATDANDGADKEATRRQLAAQLARENHIADATRIITHYIVQAYSGTRLDANEARAEIRTAVEHIVDAAAPILNINLITNDPNSQQG
jgi:hypothetical protein